MTSDPPSPDAMRDFAVQVVRALRDAGRQALWAGGCVRDQLLGAPPKDYDVATSALPDEVRTVFGKRRTLPIGAAFGVITVLGPKSAGQIEVATFRTEADYHDGRRPKRVEFTTAEQDASRRDFTINGLFYDPLADEVIDYVGGREDLAAKRIRAIGDATERFAEDKLRMLRAVRFAAALGFEIEAGTAQAIVDHAHEIGLVSAERIGGELRRMLVGPGRVRAVRLLHELQLLREVVPELAAIGEDYLAQFGEASSRLGEVTIAIALACLLAPVDASHAVSQRTMALKFTRKEAERAAWLVKNYRALDKAHEQPWSKIQPLLANEGGAELVAVYEALTTGPDAASRFCREKLAAPAEALDPPPLLTGGDLIREGIEPGPDFAKWLGIVRAAQLDEEIHSTEEALALIDSLRAKTR